MIWSNLIFEQMAPNNVTHLGPSAKRTRLSSEAVHRLPSGATQTKSNELHVGPVWKRGRGGGGGGAMPDRPYATTDVAFCFSEESELAAAEQKQSSSSRRRVEVKKT
ncbi:hypothetical protein AXG93_464s1010 [Marchantia polymorpha subsp. ruderalis]|uniref:Uncharacterized protein n=1 Tax=Marchantia polymorpha subsp. ruderalis TaxID=1480154 RepID=A0A176WQI8_MARPO|nr:hypothetical protein AXG93_464s1010 [Marchantia polymorpha subsp. ruderalis]